jgi:DNA-binding GntR family transcriptional regulator
MSILEDDFADAKMKPQTLSGQVYDKLLDMIMSNVARPDSRLNVDELSKRFGVSKTPLREALKSLEKTGLVSFKPYSGYMVKTFTAKEIEEIYKIRILLETFAIEQILENVSDVHIRELKRIQATIESNLTVPKVKLFKMNREFHDYFYSISDCPKLCEMIGLLWDNLVFFRMLLIQEDDYINNMKTEHRAYIDALEKRQGERLKALIVAALEVHAQRIPRLVQHHYRNPSE